MVVAAVEAAVTVVAAVEAAVMVVVAAAAVVTVVAAAEVVTAAVVTVVITVMSTAEVTGFHIQHGTPDGITIRIGILIGITPVIHSRVGYGALVLPATGNAQHLIKLCKASRNSVPPWMKPPLARSIPAAVMITSQPDATFLTDIAVFIPKYL